MKGQKNTNIEIKRSMGREENITEKMNKLECLVHNRETDSGLRECSSVPCTGMTISLQTECPQQGNIRETSSSAVGIRTIYK